MSSTKPDAEAETVVSGYWSGGNRRARQLAAAVPAMRPSKPATARARIESASKTKKGAKKARVAPMAPTPERQAKGPIAAPGKAIEAPHRALSLAEQLRDQRELQTPKSRLTPDQLKQFHEKGKLDHDHRTSEGMYEAALRLRRHYEGAMIGTLKAQDLNRVIGLGAGDDTKEEAWVHHRTCFLTAVRLIGWSDANPLRGAGRLVVAVVCEDMTVQVAARIHVGAGRTEVLMGAAMDRLREGLFALACHWRMI